MAIDKTPYWMRKPKPKVVERMNKIKEILGNAERTVRNIAYKLYPKLYGKLLDQKYNTTIKDTVRMRTSEMIPFEQIRESRTKLVDPKGYENVDDFIEHHSIEDCSILYSRNKRPSHKYLFENWYEKETLKPEYERICNKYDIPNLCIRGQAQWSTENKAFKRLTEDHVILYWGDNDEKGKEILEVVKRDLRFLGCKVKDENFLWVGVTPEHEKRFKLPENSKLDGFDLDDLETLIEEVIREHIDVDVYEEILRQEEKDKEYLKGFRLKVEKK
jgi:hypothetical protein